MKIIKLSKKIILISILLIIFILIITKLTISFGMQNYYNLDFTTGLVTATTLNVRSGPRYKFSCYSKSI